MATITLTLLRIVARRVIYSSCSRVFSCNVGLRWLTSLSHVTVINTVKRMELTGMLRQRAFVDDIWHRFSVTGLLVIVSCDGRTATGLSCKVWLLSNYYCILLSKLSCVGLFIIYYYFMTYFRPPISSIVSTMHHRPVCSVLYSDCTAKSGQKSSI